MPRSVATVLQEKLGTKAVPYFNRLNVPTIGVSAVRIMNHDPNRFAFEFINTSPNTIYLHLDGSVSASKGIVVGANGGNVVCVWEEDFELVTWEWYALAAAAASTFIAYEVVSAGAE